MLRGRGARRPAPAWRVIADSSRPPLLIYDGGCGFCRRGIERWRARTGDAVQYAPATEAAARFPEIPPDAYEGSAIYVEPDGSAWSGAAAVLRALGRSPSGRRWLWCYDRVPGCAWIAERLYALVARHRSALSSLTARPRR